MANSKVWLLLLQVIHALIELYKSHRQKARIDAVRAEPADEWLHKFGGTDKRTDGSAPGSDDPRGNSDG